MNSCAGHSRRDAVSIRCRTVFLLLALLVPSPMAGAKTTVAEIVRTLQDDPFWTNCPVTVQFTQTTAMQNGSFERSSTNVAHYTGLGVLTKEGYEAMDWLDVSNTSPALRGTAPAQKFFIRSNDYVMSYFLYPDAAVKKHGIRGEGTLGMPKCNCTEKFWSFPLIPAVVIQKLLDLQEPSCDETNYRGQPAVVVAGKTDDEKAEMEWHIIFVKPRETWLPVRAEVRFENRLLSTIETSFNSRAAYSPDGIRLSLFRAGKMVGSFDWSNIRSAAGDESEQRFVGRQTIPAGVIVTDYRLNRTAVYLVRDHGVFPEPRHDKLLLNVPLADRVKAPDNAVRTAAVQMVLLALLVVPTGWMILKRVRVRSAEEA